MTSQSLEWNPVDLAAIRTQLDRVLESPVFSNAERQSRFLRFVVDETLAGRSERLTQYQIGLEVFDRDASFDPAIDAIVRVEAARLRSKLRDYYGGEGSADQVKFELPKGSYAATITMEPVPPAGLVSSAVSSASVPSVEGKPVIAVLPFDNLGRDPEQEYFADGITEDLITDLSKISALAVIARNSVFSYKGTAANVQQTARDLGANYVLEGSVRKSGARVRINAQLVDAASGNHLWAERFDRELDDIFAVQDEVNANIVRALELRLSQREQIRIGGRTTSNLQAYDLVLRAEKLSRGFSKEGMSRARSLYLQALEHDPDYACVYAHLARNQVFAWIVGWLGDDCLDEAVANAGKAVALDPELALAHSALGWAYFWRRQYDEAIAEGERAIALDPSHVRAMEMLALCLCWQGRTREATELIDRANQLNPHERYYYPRGFIQFMEGDVEGAIDLFERSVERFPDFVPSRLALAAGYGLLGRSAEARSQLEQVRCQAPAYYQIDAARAGGFIADPEFRERFREGLRQAGLT